MIEFRKVIIFLTILSASLLSACGEGDSGTASAPAMESAPATTSDSSSSMGSMEKADGVVYEDEIYANWPYN